MYVSLCAISIEYCNQHYFNFTLRKFPLAVDPDDECGTWSENTRFSNKKRVMSFSPCLVGGILLVRADCFSRRFMNSELSQRKFRIVVGNFSARIIFIRIQTPFFIILHPFLQSDHSLDLSDLFLALALSIFDLSFNLHLLVADRMTNSLFDRPLCLMQSSFNFVSSAAVAHYRYNYFYMNCGNFLSS